MNLVFFVVVVELGIQFMVFNLGCNSINRSLDDYVFFSLGYFEVWFMEIECLECWLKKGKFLSLLQINRISSFQ